MTKSSARSALFVTLTGRLLLKTVPTGIPSPILSLIRNRPIGVFMLPSRVPTPKREVETTYTARLFLPDFSVSRWFRIEIEIFVCALFFIGEWQ